MSIISGNNKQIIDAAGAILGAGKVVAIPTETVYGLAGNISIDDSIKKIYELKNRPVTHPLIIHISDIEQLYIYAKSVPKYVELLANTFWPGPLTFILPKSDKVSHLVTGGQDTVAIRMPNHVLTLELIRAVGSPLAAPSANRFGKISPTRPEHVIEEFNNEVAVIDGGICGIGIESTIIDATSEDYYKVLRPGAITQNDLALALKTKFKSADQIDKIPTQFSFPGSHKKHYSPGKKLISFKSYPELLDLANEYKNVYIIHYSNYSIPNNNSSYKIGDKPDEFAKDLYHALRLGDNSSCDIILIEAPVNEIEWYAVLDRLSRALKPLM